MTYKTKGIVLGRHNFGEADRIIVFLTPERGIIRGVAKGVRKIKSRMAGHLELFSESDLMLAKGRNLDVLTSAKLRWHPGYITADYDKLRLAYLFAEMVSKLSGEGEDHPGLYETVKQGFSELNDSQGDKVVELWFKLSLLDKLGYQPGLEACMICGTSDPSRAYLFNVELGGIVDIGCSTPGNLEMTQNQIKLWRLMLEREPKAIRELDGTPELAAATMAICDQFYDYTFGKRFRSSEVLG